MSVLSMCTPLFMDIFLMFLINSVLVTDLITLFSVDHKISLITKKLSLRHWTQRAGKNI